jgi:hypothetical protein
VAEPAVASPPSADAKPAIECVGCRGLVPDIEGPIHRYMTASPGCWRAYTELMAGGLPPSPESGLAVDAYAVTHPGAPGPQSTPSVWIHLVTLCCTLERGWPVDRAVFLRRLGADGVHGWPSLDRPDQMGDVTAIDVAAALETGDGSAAAELTRRWVQGAWAAWGSQHNVVRARASELVAKLG